MTAFTHGFYWSYLNNSDINKLQSQQIVLLEWVCFNGCLHFPLDCVFLFSCLPCEGGAIKLWQRRVEPVTHGSANVNRSVCFLGREWSVLYGKEGKKDLIWNFSDIIARLLHGYYQITIEMLIVTSWKRKVFIFSAIFQLKYAVCFSFSFFLNWISFQKIPLKFTH